MLELIALMYLVLYAPLWILLGAFLWLLWRTVRPVLNWADRRFFIFRREPWDPDYEAWVAEMQRRQAKL